MRYLGLTVLILTLVAGCSEYGYRYQPDPQIIYSRIFADYREQNRAVDVLVDADGLRLTQIENTKSDGPMFKPTSIDPPQFKAAPMRGFQEEIYGPELAIGPTVAHFDKDEIVPRQWNVRLNIRDVPSEIIRVGNPPAGETRQFRGSSFCRRGILV